MRSSNQKFGWKAAGELSKHSGLFVSTIAFFLLSLMLVFFGFIGYVSRVSLSSEFQKDGNQNIDYVFMILDHNDKDEADLIYSRFKLNEDLAKFSRQKNEAEWKAYLSPEFREYFVEITEIQSLFERDHHLVTPHYLGEVRTLETSRATFNALQVVTRIEYKSEITDTDRKRFADVLAPKVRSLSSKIFDYATKHGSSLDTIENEVRTSRDYHESRIREILSRRPQLAFTSEIGKYIAAERFIGAPKPEVTDQQRAIIRSYKQALFGWGGTILPWPTIVSTMIVTLAMGLLGGVVSFMGIAIAHPRFYNFSELFRRSILGITAALGIFLFAGSGLLVLTAQSGKPVGAGSIELSPYFVAFLAFISGFLADDASARLTRAGRAIFQTDEAKARREAGDHQRGRRGRKRQHR